MGNTLMGCADDLLTNPGIFKNDPTSRSVNIFSAAGFCLKQCKQFYLPAKAQPSKSGCSEIGFRQISLNSHREAFKTSSGWRL